MTRILNAACAGFLLAVLWFDLMFDVQALGAPEGSLPESVLASIAGYYRRVTTDARPMGFLVGIVMMILLATNVVALIRDRGARVRSATTLVFATPPVVLAMARVLPNAVELGQRSGTIEAQSALARSILADHLFCLGSMTVVLVAQLWPARK